MGDFKSKLPSLQELASAAGKLAKGLKASVSEIMDDYKRNHPHEAVPAAKPIPPESSAEPKAEAPKVETPKTEAPKVEEKK